MANCITGMQKGITTAESTTPTEEIVARKISPKRLV
jgi:hypothetical protein